MSILQNNILRHAVCKFISSLTLLAGVSVLVFVLMKLQPVNPFLSFIDPSASVENVEQQLHELGYYDPIWKQYLSWMNHALEGDLGYSARYKQPVVTMIAEHFTNTLLLSGPILLISSLLAILAGIIMAAKSGQLLDRVLNSLSFLGISLPSFFFSLILIRFLSYGLGWFPASGLSTAGSEAQGWQCFTDILNHMVLPALVLILTQSAILIHYTKATLSLILKQDYILMARAKGSGRWRTVFRHGLRSGWPVIITVLGLQIPTLLSGTVIVEAVFVWPGIGHLAYQAILHNDHSLVMGITLFTSTLIIFMNFMADLLCQWVDPRIRRGKA